MTLGEQSAAIFVLTVVLYGAAGVGLLLRGWVFRAGLITFIISLAPLTWQALFTESDAPGFGVLFLLMILGPLLLMAVGAVAALVRVVQRLRRRAVDRTGIF